MKPNTHPNVTGKRSRQGYMLFYVVGTLLVLSLIGLIAVQSALLESRSAVTQMERAQALAHAEAGINMVRIAVENEFVSGSSMSAALTNLEITAPSGIEFDPINNFIVVVPERVFAFEVTGRSEDARVNLAVQLRRKELLDAGVYGTSVLGTQPNVSIYGYDSREVSNPTIADSNGEAAVGSNTEVDFGNNFFLDGDVILGRDGSGTQAMCNGCFGLDTVQNDHIDPDPLGMNNGGTLSQRFALIRVSNDNSTSTAITSNELNVAPGGSVTFEAGDYYFSELTTKPNVEVIIDNTNGPVRFFVDGEVDFAPNNGLSLNDPFGFQVYSSSSDDFRIKPNGDLSMFAYAPNADIGLWPNGKMLGGFWGRTVEFQPGGSYFVDTSLQDRWYSNKLVLHTRYMVREL